MEDLDDRFFNTDQHGCLKVPLVLWLGLLIHTRHWIFFLLTLVSLAVGAPNIIAIRSEFASFWMAAAELPSLLVLIAGVLRQPEAQKWVRIVWANGNKFMFTSGLLYSLFVIWWLFVTPSWNRWPELYFASTALLDIAIAYWAISHALPRQVFSEFPKSFTP